MTTRGGKVPYKFYALALSTPQTRTRNFRLESNPHQEPTKSGVMQNTGEIAHRCEVQGSYPGQLHRRGRDGPRNHTDSTEPENQTCEEREEATTGKGQEESRH